MKHFIVIVSLLACLGASAQDRYFARTYNTNVLPKGNIDIELWHTSRLGHEGQYFHGMDQRLEFEVGLGHNVQTAFYLNRFQNTYSDSLDNLVRTSDLGFSNEWKWKLADPSANKVGFALYGELGVTGDEVELETKLIFDKYIGKSLVALNVVSEIEEEVERENGETEMETEATPLEFDFGYMYNVKKNLGIGVEVVDHNDIAQGKWNNSVLYAGPTVNFRGDRWFVIANYLPQLSNLHRTELYAGNKVLDVHERAEARLLVGFSF